MAKMTKAQCRKRINESIIKLGKVADYMRVQTDMTKADQNLLSGIFLDLHKLRKKLD